MESLNDTLARAAKLFAPLGESRNLRFLPAAQDQTLPMNRRLLEQAVCNLLENAWEHSPAGTEITLETDTQPNQVLIRVTDSGGCIPAERLDHLLDDPEEQTQLGLGLPVCQCVAEFHHGSLRIRNNDHGGVTAVLTLPTQRLRRG